MRGKSPVRPFYQSGKTAPPPTPAPAPPPQWMDQRRPWIIQVFRANPAIALLSPPINYCLLSLFQGNDGIRFFLSISILRRCFIGGEGGTTTTPPHHRDRHRHRHRRRLHHQPRPQPQYQPHPEPQPQQQPQPQPQRHKSAQTTSTHVCNPLSPGARPPPPRGPGAAALLRGAPRWRPKGGPAGRRPRPSRR